MANRTNRKGAKILRTDLQGERGLLIAILWQAHDDYKKGHKVDDVQRFVKSPWYADILDHLELNPALVPNVMS